MAAFLLFLCRERTGDERVVGRGRGMMIVMMLMTMMLMMLYDDDDDVHFYSAYCFH